MCPNIIFYLMQIIKWALIQTMNHYIHFIHEKQAATCQLYARDTSFDIKVLHHLRKLRALIWCLRSFICHFILNYFFFLLHPNSFISYVGTKTTTATAPTIKTTRKKLNVTFFISEGLNSMAKMVWKSDFGCWAKSKWDWMGDWQTC